ncbi:MAG: VOC family protein [Humibacillus sp.]|nr:VOC family protein [Humibacillus sp.]
MPLDHVIFAVTDLELAAQELQDAHGLASVPGGRHPAWGTANRIVPMGGSYLELVAVVDAHVATRSAFGRWVAAAHPDGGGLTPLGWAVRTDDLDAVCSRLGLSASAGSRQTDDGRVLAWRLAGVEHAAAEPHLPFFIEWGSQTPLPGTTPVRHPAGRSEISRVCVTGDVRRLTSWLADSAVPVTAGSGPPAVVSVDVVSAGRVWTLGGSSV